ncbi:MAG: hypothetical protein LKK16_03265 [Bacteroidales bacterium]|nr:hypothetical protein [Bacteroidales bacterium]MCH3941631.1 hypothetical protein [Bacteroidales bacterium]MCI2135332.1 hypothetical protein [Bacteroidales bacterium]
MSRSQGSVSDGYYIRLLSLRSLRSLPMSSTSSLRYNLLTSGTFSCPCLGVDT